MKTMKHEMAISVNETLLQKAQLNENALLYVLNTMEDRMKEETRETFFLQSQPFDLGFYLKKKNNTIKIEDIILGDLYLHTGMVTYELKEYLKESIKH